MAIEDFSLHCPDRAVKSSRNEERDYGRAIEDGRLSLGMTRGFDSALQQRSLGAGDATPPT